MTTTSAVSGNGRPDRSGSAGIVALHSERRSKSVLRARPSAKRRPSLVRDVAAAEQRPGTARHPARATASKIEPGRVERHQVDERESEGPIETAKDHSLADRARNGDLDAFEELMHARIDAIYRLSLAIVGDEADARDSTQETFISAWRRIRELRDPARFEAWLQRIAVNAARMTLRARGRRRVREIPSGDIATLAGSLRSSEPGALRSRPARRRARPAACRTANDPGPPPPRGSRASPRWPRSSGSRSGR